MYRETTLNTLNLERMNIKHKIKRNETKNMLFAAIVECSDDAIISKDLNGEIITWNKAAEKLYGYKASEMIGKSISLIIPKNKIKKYTEIANKLKNGKKIMNYKTRTKAKDGKIINVKLKSFPVKNKNEEIIGVSTVAKEIYEESNREKNKDDFINIASHELKTPITSIKAYAQILERKFKKNGDLESASYIDKMHNQINKLTYLIRDLVDINKIQTKELKTKKELFDIEALIDEIIEEIKLLVSDVKITRIGSVKKKILADKDQIGQVVINLITNAIKFASSSDEIIIQLKQNTRSTTVGIQDFGSGIDIAYQKKIFERFYRINRIDNSEFPGLGVGLYISSEIIKGHNGKMWVKSSKNQGCTFYFSLPI